MPGFFSGAAQERAVWGSKALLLPLYSRLKEDEILSNELRQRIHEFIKEKPGVNFSTIKKELNLNTGALLYHLSVLKREELVKEETDGPYKRFYPAGYHPVEDDTMATSRKVLRAVHEHPGATQRELAQITGLSPQALSYHLRNLYYERKIVKSRKGRVVRYYPREN